MKIISLIVYSFLTVAVLFIALTVFVYTINYFVYAVKQRRKNKK